MSLVNHPQFGRCGERFLTAALPVPVQHPGCPTDFAPNLELGLVLDLTEFPVATSPCTIELRLRKFVGTLYIG